MASENITLPEANFYNHIELATSCISFVYAFPAFYTVFRLGILCARGRLPGSFYKLLFVFGVNDLVSYLIQMVTIRMAYWGVCSFYDQIMTGYVPTLLYFTMNVCSYVQVCGCISMAANRASSVLIPHSYERLWRTYGWLWIITACIALQYLNYFLLIVGVRYEKIGSEVYLVFVVGDDHADIGFVNCYVCLTGSIISLLFNVYTGYSLHHNLQLNNHKISLIDLKFFYICIILFLCQVLWTLKQFVIHYASFLSPIQLFAFMVGPIVTDLNCLFPIYSILILSKEIRSEVLPWSKSEGSQSETIIRAVSIATLSHKSGDMPIAPRNIPLTRVSMFG